MIYDQIKQLDKGYKIVWVTNKIYPFDDENVITVKRLSQTIIDTYRLRNIG